MRHRFYKALKTLLLVALGFSVLVFAFLCVERARGAFALSRYKHQLAQQGEILSVAAWRLPEPAGSNGAPAVVEAANQLVKGPVLPDHYPPRMRMTPSGRAIVCFRQPQWVEDKTNYTWAQLALDLSTNRAVLDRARAGLAQPVFENHLDYAAGPKIAFTHLSKAKSLSYWFGSECQLALHEARTADALPPLLAQVHLPRLLSRDRIVISELVRIALGAIARTDTWEALQADGWNDGQLWEIQNAWDQLHFLTNYSQSLEGERIFAATTFDLCRKSNEQTASLLFWAEEWLGNDFSSLPSWRRFVRALPAGEAVDEFLKNQVYSRVWRFAWLDQCELYNLRAVQGLVEISRAAGTHKSFSLADTRTERVIEDASPGGFYDELRFPSGLSGAASLSHAIGRAMRAETERSLVLAAVALKRHSLQNSNPPASLDALVPTLLSSLPIDYMNGKSIKYRLTTNGVPLLYSVGENGTDDHGDNRLYETNKLSNPWARNDYVWPLPASPEDAETLKRDR